MQLKKIFTILTLLIATSVHAGSKATPPAPTTPAVEQHADNPSPPDNPPVVPIPLNQEAPSSLPPPSLPSSHEMTDSYENAFVRMLVTLLGLVFLVFATFWVLRRMGKGKFKMGSSRMINVIERRAISPKTMLYIVEVGNKQVLISESQVEVRALSTEETPEPLKE